MTTVDVGVMVTKKVAPTKIITPSSVPPLHQQYSYYDLLSTPYEGRSVCTKSVVICLCKRYVSCAYCLRLGLTNTILLLFLGYYHHSFSRLVRYPAQGVVHAVIIRCPAVKPRWVTSRPSTVHPWDLGPGLLVLIAAAVTTQLKWADMTLQVR
ncbi:hypothetical protein VFPPC_18032 [Pochonia chlamydosporia 170]|uniref:Uncharacterized protein n=1 Tax=Pochonia chlamydosporia 170 TaxID=1380566 RepID=A0A219APN9_METCM|nr:hypothetical protein VFPPC_18032 [Pochonia chlamydosporia 170]OWT42777.1 hypothetical protein VFPPC_18032 [Pochonia chlamydosporia 170]